MHCAINHLLKKISEILEVFTKKTRKAFNCSFTFCNPGLGFFIGKSKNAHH